VQATSQRLLSEKIDKATSQHLISENIDKATFQHLLSEKIDNAVVCTLLGVIYSDLFPSNKSNVQHMETYIYDYNTMHTKAVVCTLHGLI
jgi:hypothetical protein